MTVSPNDDERARREQLCKKLGLGNINQVYQLVVEGTAQSADFLTRKGLNATSLGRLGYSAAALKRLGYSGQQLETLGFGKPRPAKEESGVGGEGARPRGKSEAVASTGELKQLIDSGARAEKLNSLGYNVVICKKAGYSASHLNSIGFDLHQLRGAFPLPELRRAGFNVNDLRRYHHGSEFKQSGFSATEMRMAGFTAKQLLSFGYPDNAVTTAGYSIVELDEAGLSKRVVDKRGFQ